MTTAQIAKSVKAKVRRAASEERPAGGIRFDWGAAMLSVYLMGAMYLDG